MEQARRSQRSDARQQTRVRPSVTMVDQRKENYHYEEALKTLRTNIQFAGAEITSILVTSCYPNEGKSDIVSQLAKEMGKAGKKVLLLDADIRKSTFIQRFQIEGEIKGLSQYLSGQVAVRDILYTTNYENVDMARCSMDCISIWTAVTLTRTGTLSYICRIRYCTIRYLQRICMITGI